MYDTAFRLAEGEYRAAAEKLRTHRSTRFVTPIIRDLKALGLEIPYVMDDGNPRTQHDARMLRRAAQRVHREKQRTRALGIPPDSPKGRERVSTALCELVTAPKQASGFGHVYSSADLLAVPAHSAKQRERNCTSSAAFFASLAILADLPVSFELLSGGDHGQHIYARVALDSTKPNHHVFADFQTKTCSTTRPVYPNARHTTPLTPRQFVSVYLTARVFNGRDHRRQPWAQIERDRALLTQSVQISPELARGHYHLGMHLIFHYAAMDEGIAQLRRAVQLAHPSEPWIASTKDFLREFQNLADLY